MYRLLRITVREHRLLQNLTREWGAQQTWRSCERFLIESGFTSQSDRSWIVREDNLGCLMTDEIQRVVVLDA